MRRRRGAAMGGPMLSPWPSQSSSKTQQQHAQHSTAQHRTKTPLFLNSTQNLSQRASNKTALKITLLIKKPLPAPLSPEGLPIKQPSKILS